MTKTDDYFFRGRSYTLAALAGWTVITICLVWFNINWVRFEPSETTMRGDSLHQIQHVSHLNFLFWGYGVLWLVGIAGIYLTSHDLKKRFQEREKLILSIQKNHELIASSEEKFSRVFNLSPVMATLASLEEGRYLDVNQKFLEVSKYTRDEVIGRTSIEIGWISTQDRARLKQDLQSLGRVTKMELLLHAKDGREVFCICDSELIELEGGTYVLSLMQDVTEKKQAEEALEKSEAQYRLITENMRDTVWLMDMDFKPIYTSPSVTRLRGFTPLELRYLPLDQNLPPDSMRRAQVIIESALAPENINSTSSAKMELEYYKKDGTTFWSEDTFVLIRGEDGNPVGILGSGHEITEKKKAEDALRESEEKLRTVFNTMEEGLALNELVYDEQGEIVDYRILEVNPAYERIANVTHEQAVGKLATEIYKMPAEYINAFWKEHLNDDHIVTELYEDRLKAWKHISTSRPVQGKFTTIFFDITEQKKAEAALRTSEGQYRLLFEEMMDGFALHDIICDANGKPVDYRFLIVNPAFEKLTGLRAGSIIGRTLREVLPDAESSWVERYGRVALDGQPEHFEEYSKNLQKHFEVRAFSPAPKQFAVILHDITQHKNAEEIKKKMQQDYESLIQNVDGVVWESGIHALSFSFVSRQAEQLLGYPIEQWITDPTFWVDHIHPEDRESTVDFCAAKAKMKSSFELEYRMIAADGRVVWLRDTVKVVLEDDQPVKLLGIMIDITEKKQSDERLRQLSLVVEQSPASVVITDLNGNINYVNPKFIQISGYALEDIIHNNPRIIQSGNTDVETYTQLWDSITSGRVWHGELQNKKKNGEYYWEDVLISPLLNGNGKITHFVSVKEDITERKLAEKEIIEKSQELEALFKISSHLRTAQTAQEMIPVVLEQMQGTFNSDANALILLETDRIHFKYILGSGLLGGNTGLEFESKNSISGRIMQTLEPYITLDFTNDPFRSPSIKNTQNIGPTVIVPLQSEKEFIGTLLCARAKDSALGPFTAAEIKLLRAIGEMVGNALRRAKLYDDALSRLQRVQALRSIDTAINSNMDLLLTLNMLISQAIALMKVDAAATLLYNPVTHMLEYATAQGFHHKEIENANPKLNHGFANTAIIERRMVKVTNLKNAEDRMYREIAIKEGFESCHIVPMIANGQVCGILEVYNKTAFSPDQEWLDFLEALGGQAAIAIHSAQLFENLEKSNLELSLAYDATIEGWSKALELRDKETEGHTLRVTAWTVKLAQLAGLSEADIIQVRRGALLHDIGKMGVPDHILNKNGDLTSQEWEIMHQHTQYAYNMIRPIIFLRPAIDIPYCHHEKWDGTGYPQGLKGEQIPFVARLFAIIDVWDAITSNRPYRKAWSFEKALNYVKSESGRHFDPKIVELFLKMVDSLRNK